MEFYLKKESDIKKTVDYILSDINNSSNKPTVLALVGDLGSGKTTFTKYLAKELNIENTIISPTFIIHREYKKPKDVGFLHHLDFYRLENKHELDEIGFETLLKKDNIVVIEWADKFKEYLDNINDINLVYINFEYINENERRITIE